MKLLITIENICEFRPLSKGIPAVRIQPYIQEAQQFDLKRLLGDPLYVDFMTYFDNADVAYDKYRDLLNGKNYVVDGNTIEHPGLRGYLSYMTLARFFNNNQINVTKYGLVEKNGEDSTPLDWKAIAAAVAEIRSNGLNLQVDIQKYLRSNPTTYPLYNYQDGSASGQLGVKFFDPDDINGGGPTAGGSGRT